MALSTSFASLHTVEKDRHLADRASALFQLYANVNVWFGDSPKILDSRLLPAIQRPYIAFLDANTGPRMEALSASPLMRELQACLQASRAPYIVVIDDIDRAGIHPFPHLNLLKAIMDGMEIDFVQSLMICRHPFLMKHA